jgi:hypothetical protein
MNTLTYAVMVALLAGTVALAMWLGTRFERPPRDHLCQIAEISPDMTPAEKERCRMLRMYQEGKTL